jgi:hypothetical protein
MAVLTEDQKYRVRDYMAKSGVPINYIKPVINAAAQAVEDRLTSAATKVALSNDIDLATTPFVFTAAQKVQIVKAVIERLVERWS